MDPPECGLEEPTVDTVGKLIVVRDVFFGLWELRHQNTPVLEVSKNGPTTTELSYRLVSTSHSHLEREPRVSILVKCADVQAVPD